MNLRSVLLVSALAMSVAANAITIANFTFEGLTAPTTASTTFAPYTADEGAGSASAFHATASTFSTPSGNGSAKSLSSNTWAVGDYYQFTASTLGQAGVGVSFDQTGSNTGPRDFKLAYSTNGTTFSDFATYGLIVSTWTPGTVMSGFTQTFDLSSVAALNNKATVTFRLVDNSTTSINAGTVAAGGTGRVDNFLITATPQTVPEPASLAALGLGALAFVRRRRSAK